MSPAELEQIRSDIYAEPWNDPQLFPDLLARAIRELGVIARTGERCTCPSDLNTPRNPECRVFHGDPTERAEQALRAMQNRARSGVPFGEPEVVL